MSKKRVMVDVRGRQHEWGVIWFASDEQIQEMRADGIDVKVIEYTVPSWAADLGLAPLWCAMQDIWNLRNPWPRP